MTDDAPDERTIRYPNLAKALAAAQAVLNNPAKKAVNPHYQSHYADLASGLNAVRTLGEYGIAVIQPTVMRGDLLVVETWLMHESGEKLYGEWPVGLWNKLSQPQLGGAMTYARRYSLFAMVGIAGEDDDGNSVKDVQIGEDRVAPPRRRRIDIGDITRIETLLRDTESDVAKIYEKYDVGSLSDLTEDQYKAVIRSLEKKAQAMNEANSPAEPIDARTD